MMSSPGPLEEALAALAPVSSNEQKLRDDLVAAHHHADCLKRSLELVAGELTVKNGAVEVVELIEHLKRLKSDAALTPALRKELTELRKEVARLRTDLSKRTK